MSPDLVFTVCNNAILPAWLLLAVAPGWIWTQRVVHTIWIPLLLGLVYAWAFTANTPAPEGGGFTSLDAVMKLFTSPYVMLAGWVHYIVFDLFIGAWETRDARRHGIGQLWLLPCLALTLMLGPLGLLAYLVLRWVKTRDTGLDESVALAGAGAA